MCYASKIGKNATAGKKSRVPIHIGPIMRGSLFFLMSFHHLAIIKIICAHHGWQYIPMCMKRYWKILLEVAL